MTRYRIARWFLVGALVVCIGVAVVNAGAWPAPQPKEYGVGVVKYRGKGAEYWHWQFKRSQQELAKQKRIMRRRASSLEAIRLASIAYGESYSMLLRRAICESRLNPNARNRTPIYNGEHATGLFQFIPSTFASTPFAAESIWSPYANALAAGWMHANGRGGEWACR